MRIDIVGGGIGGLTLAIALHQKNFDVHLYEQAKEFKPVGAGIILANNAMRVYDKLGLKEILEQSGNPISSVNITKQDLSPISKMDLKPFEQKYQVKNTAIHRGKLQELLVNQLSDITIHLDHQLKSVVKNEDSFVLDFSNGKSISSNIVIGADGINSTIRSNLFSTTKIRNAKQVCWRGVADFDLPTKYQHELNEAWGVADRFGMVQIAPGKVYWYALKSFKNSSNEWSVNELSNYFKSYHSVVRGLLSATPVADIHTADITDLAPIKSWYQENVCLIGDAAHATTPNLGQGACQSIEDAYALAECLAKYDVNNAFAKYQKLRMPKAKFVVNTSWNFGKVSHWKNPIAIGLRNTLMKWTPDSTSTKNSEKIFRLAEVV